MGQETFNKNRIIKNSATLYVRMMFTMVLNLLTTRFVLTALGVEDMGVFGVVGSVVSMFTVFVSGLLSAAQRFITFELGKTDGDVRNVFNTSINLILILSIALFALLEVGGVIMLENGVNIPDDRMNAAHWVLQISILTCVFNLNSTAYNALLIAHERMGVWAAISVVQVVFTCATAYSLIYFVEKERLVLYSLFTFIVQAFIQLFYICYCKKHFPEAKYQRCFDRKLILSIAKFAGASTFSGILLMIINQGLVLIVNWTYGVAMNAVYNIGVQVKNSVLSFGQNIYRAVAPQITKTYAAGEYDKHKKLVCSGSKMGIYMILLIIIPFWLRSNYILELWLGKVPMYASEFTVGFVFQSLLYAGFEPFRTAVLATGKVARFFVYSELIHMLVLPFAYFFGTLFETPVAIIIVISVMEVVYCASMSWFGTRVGKVDLRELFFGITIPVVLVLVSSMTASYAISIILPENIVGMLLLLIINSIILCISIYTLGLTSFERNIVKAVVDKMLKKQICKN